MKKQIFAAAMALCLMATTTLFAQDPKSQAEPKTPPTIEQIAERMTQRMTEQLKLTEAQTKQVYELNLAQIKQMKAIREKMEAARQAQAEEMKKILSTEQFMQWSQMQGPRGERSGHGPHMKPGKQGPHHADCPKDCPRKNNKK